MELSEPDKMRIKLQNKIKIHTHTIIHNRDILNSTGLLPRLQRIYSMEMIPNNVRNFDKSSSNSR
jgi:hypothetical protein